MTRVLYRTALAVLLAGNAAGLAVLVGDGHGMPPLLGAVALGYTGAVVLAYACGAAWHAGHARACRSAHRDHRPSGRRVVPGEAVDGERVWAEYERARAQVVASAPPPPTVAYTAAMPTVSSVVGRFNAAVGDAAPGAWTPAVSAVPDLSAWGAFEYGGKR
ncbi:MAG TPA: hypothetical protein VFU74_22150 [Actinocrinis sp.]|nr:hypothetical protein [Actinocrinis sp.]